MKAAKYCSSVLLALLLWTIGLEAQSLRVKRVDFPDGDRYTIIYRDQLKVGVTTKRPVWDEQTYLCVAAAFTRLDDGGIDGLHISNGKVLNWKRINSTLGSGLLIMGDSLAIIDTRKGRLLTDSMISSVVNRGGAFFQQMSLVMDGRAESFKDTHLFQRRAIVKFKDGTWAIIENHDRKTLKQFAADLVSLNVVQALYLDMGTWDEGWYREDGQVKVMGNLRTQTARQSNWLVFYFQ